MCALYADYCTPIIMACQEVFSWYTNRTSMKATTILAALAILFAGQSQASRNEGKDAEKSHKLNAKEAGKADCGPKTVIENQTVYGALSTPHENSKTEERPAKAHDRVDYINASSTAVIAVFTILLFVGVILQVRTSRAIERAWVMAEVEHDPDKWSDKKPHVLEGSGTSGNSTAIYAVLTCRNAGRTPAWIEETVAKFELVTELPEEPDLGGAEYVQTTTIPLGMGDGDAFPHTQRIPWVPIAEGHQTLGQLAVIYGRVTYRDIFNKKRITTFGYKIRPHGRLERLEGRPKYNHNT